ncbi:MAG: RNA helicase, partial [Methylotenera sp.]
AAISLVDFEEAKYLKDIEKLIKREIPKVAVEGFVPPTKIEPEAPRGPRNQPPRNQQSKAKQGNRPQSNGQKPAQGKPQAKKPSPPKLFQNMQQPNAHKLVHHSGNRGR